MTIEVKIIKKQLIAENIVHLNLESLDGKQLPGFEPGAHIDLHIDDNTVRQYSLVPSRQNSQYEIAILKEANGRGGSKKVHEALQSGDTVRISQPRNHFSLKNAQHSLLIAGGIGITPILAMAKHLSNTDQSFEMHYCSRSKENAAFHDAILQSELDQNTTFYFDDQDQRFDISILDHPEQDKRLFVCGPEGFINFIRDTAASKGWSDDRIHYELFQKSDQDTTGHGERFNILIEGTDTSIEVTEDETALEALDRHGIDVPCSCEQGICGTCVLEVIDGIPDHQDMYLTDSEKEQNNKFTPCCSRALSSQLTIKL